MRLRLRHEHALRHARLHLCGLRRRPLTWGGPAAATKPIPEDCADTTGRFGHYAAVQVFLPGAGFRRGGGGRLRKMEDVTERGDTGWGGRGARSDRRWWRRARRPMAGCAIASGFGSRVYDRNRHQRRAATASDRRRGCRRRDHAAGATSARTAAASAPAQPDAAVGTSIGRGASARDATRTPWVDDLPSFEPT